MWGLVAAIVLSIASVAYTMVTSRKMQTREDSERAGIQVTRFGIDQAIPVVRGTRKVKPIVVYQGTKDIDGDPSNEVLYVAMVWAIGPVSRLSDFQFDDLPYSNFGSFGTGTSQRVEHLLGSDDQTMPTWFHEAPDDMTGMDFSGLAVTFVKLVMDDEFKRYPQGRPDFSAVITAGSSNPVDALEDFLTNSDWGMGFPIADLDLLHNDLMRSYCNNVVDGHNLMTCNVVLDTEDDLQNNLDIILQTCRGYLVEGQNGLRLEIDRQRDAVLHVSESMLTGGLKTASVNINDRYNSVTIRFPDRDLNWENNEVTFPEKESPLSLQWLEEDNQVPLTHEETVDGIDTYEHALQLAEVLARTSRTGMTLDMSVKAWIGCQVEEMDVVTVESQLRGWEAKPFAVREIEYRENETRLKLVEYQDSNYLWRSKPAKPDYPDTLKRNPLEVAAPGDLSFLDSDQPNVAGRLSWTGPGGYVAGYDVRVMAGNLVVWQQHAKTNQLAIPLFLSGDYQFLVRTVGALAVSSWSVLAVDLVAPDAPFEVQTDTGNTYIILRPQSDSLAFGTEYEFWFNDELRGTGVAWQIEGLQPDTEYAFQVRAVNAVGQSEFVPVTATTTKDASVVLDILSGQLTRDILDANLNAYFDGIDESMSSMATKIEATETNLGTVTEDVQGIKNELVNFDRDVEDASRSAFETAVAMQGYMTEYDRRLLEQETLTDATVYRDPETGQIINRAYQYTDARYSEATIRMDGLASDILLSTQEIERVEAATGNRITQAEAAIQLQSSVISQKASFSDVTEAISGAMAAITPAYSWQFNTSAEGWPNVSWQQDGTIIGTVFERSDLSFDASENTAIRLRVKSETGGTLSWNGGSQAVAIPSPSGATEFETLILTLSADDGWTGTINAIRIEMDAEIASFEIGKPSASELQMQELSYRITQAEQELDAENARWSTYITQDYWDTNALKQSDVSNTLDAWNTTYQVTAQLKVLSDNDTVQKANQAKSWVDGANATITDLVVAYNNKPGGTDDQLQQQSEQMQAAQQDIDALRGEISQTVFSITELGNRQGDRDKGYNALLDSFNHFRQTGEIETEKVALSYAQQRITANTDRLESHAQSLLQLIAVQGEHQSSLTRLDQATATNERAIAQTNSTLTAKLNAESQARSEAISQVETTAQQARATLQQNLESQLSEESQALSTAISQVETTAQQARATLQQNLESQLSEESQARNTAISQVETTAQQARATLQQNLESQLSEESQALSTAISQVETTAQQARATLQQSLESQLSEESQARNTAISQVESNAQQALSSATQSLTAELEKQQAKVDFHASAFVNRNGTAVAKGGLTTDVNGRVSGMVNTNDGSNSSLDMLADYVRLGVMENGTFKPVLQLDSQLKELILRGRLLLGDGLELKNAASIQSQVGSGLYTLTLRNGVFPSDATATSDFVTTYGRNPEKDAHLTYRNAAGTASSMKRWTGSAWSTPSMIVHGDQVTTGTMTGNRLVAGTEITTPVLKGGTGEFSGTVRAQDGSFIDKVEIGSAGGYRVFIRSVASAGYNVLEVVNSSGDVMFAVQGNGNIYSVGGGYLDNLTIGTNVDVMGRVRANQIIGDVVSAEAVSVSKTSHTSSSWRTVATVSGVNNTGHDASVVLNPFSIYAQFGLSPERDEQMRGYATYYCRVLYNGAEVSRTSARLWTETGGGSSVRYTSFMSPTYCRNASPDEAFTLTVQIYCTMSTTGRGEGDQTMNAECDTVAQVFRSGSAFN